MAVFGINALNVIESHHQIGNIGLTKSKAMPRGIKKQSNFIRIMGTKH